MSVVLIYGPPAAGKLTVARELSARTGYRLFHNHLTDNAVRALFDFGTADYVRLLWRFRLELIAEATRAGVDFVFTLNSARGIEPQEPVAVSIANVERVVREQEGKIHFVHLEPSREVLEERVLHESRALHGKLRSVERLRELMLGWSGRPLHASHLSIDNSSLSASDAAALIEAHYGLSATVHWSASPPPITFPPLEPNA